MAENNNLPNPLPSRLAMLEEMLAENPTDPFNHYALALEYKSINPSQAESGFNKLLTLFPNYLPAYYPAAHFFAEYGQTEKAETLFLQGIALAHQQGNLKTARELQSALDLLDV